MHHVHFSPIRRNWKFNRRHEFDSTILMYAYHMGRRPKTNGKQTLSVRERAYRHIQQIIANGTLEAGAGISELSLAKEWAAAGPDPGSNEPACRRGHVGTGCERRHGRGAVEARGHHRGYELREALEVYAVGKVASIPFRPADRDRLQFMVDEFLVLKKELETSGAKELDKMQSKRFFASDLGFHALLVSMAHNSRIQKLINETRLLIRIFSIQPGEKDAAQLQSIYEYHQRILDAVAQQDRARAMQVMAEHIQISQRERLNDYDHWRRENTLMQIMPAIFDIHDLEPKS